MEEEFAENIPSLHNFGQGRMNYRKAKRSTSTSDLYSSLVFFSLRCNRVTTQGTQIPAELLASFIELKAARRSISIGGLEPTSRPGKDEAIQVVSAALWLIVLVAERLHNLHAVLYWWHNYDVGEMCINKLPQRCTGNGKSNTTFTTSGVFVQIEKFRIRQRIERQICGHAVQAKVSNSQHARALTAYAATSRSSAGDRFIHSS